MSDKMTVVGTGESAPKADAAGFSFWGLYDELVSSPLNMFLTALCLYILYKMFYKPKSDDDDGEQFVLPPPLPKQDMTLEQLRQHDGKGDDKRVCIAVNGKIYDCTKGRQFYGVGGPYAAFAGRDATRALANFDVSAIKDTWDDVSDLNESEMSSVQEWQEQFNERYDYVGNLVKELPELPEHKEVDANQTGADTEVNKKSQ